MKLRCLECGSDEISDLTHEVKNKEEFYLYFKRYIYCPQCDEYKFLKDRRRIDGATPLATQQPPPKKGANVIVSNKL
ncbi:MAG: hypothetical protein ACFE9Z_03070 [Promethearchaeota archaeon]